MCGPNGKYTIIFDLTKDLNPNLLKNLVNVKSSLSFMSAMLGKLKLKTLKLK